MTLIDQRILIDAPVEAVWKMLTDSRELRGWHAGYTGVSILTTHETGVGVRRRCGLAATGKDAIEEITAWVDGLGYEYVMTEGGPFRSLTGRFRLQGNPDGTSVQWVISYEPKGLMGVLRDRLKGKREMAAMMAASLRELRRRIDSLGIRMDDDYRARVSIRGRLNANERAQYQPRYATTTPSSMDEVSPADIEATSVTPATSVPTPLVPSAPVPSFVANLTDGQDRGFNAGSETRPRKPDGLQASIDAQQADQPASASLPYSTAEPRFERPVAEPELAPPEDIMPPPPAVVVPDIDEDVPFHQQITPPRGMPAVRVSDEEKPAPAQPAVAATPAPQPVETPPVAPAQPPAPAPTPAKASTPAADVAADLPPQTPKHDTGEISIWEAFGVQRPSERDSAALDELMREANARQRTVITRGIRRVPKRPAHLRVRTVVMGLRLRLVLYRARVRWHRRQP